jgi:glycosyltransferase involved in cell wall biosynthesis
MTSKHPLSVAIIGTRGVPARYGGFETFAAELSTRLAERGHDLTVYGRGPAAHAMWGKVRTISLPAWKHKYLETVSNALLSTLDALARDFDVVLVCNAANAFVLPICRAARLPVAINVDGIERRRRKWNALGRLVYAVGEAMSVTFASAVVADARVIADYYSQRFAVQPTVIPYGSQFPAEPDSDVLARLGLAPRRYLLYVSRFEPENNPLEVVTAYRRVRTDLPLVMVGEGLYARDLVEETRRQADSRILFPGALYGADYRTLQRNALLYIQSTEVGGTHPALIEAMASGGAVVALNTPENREVGEDGVEYFRLRPDETLSSLLQSWLDDPGRREWFRPIARQRAARLYDWDRVTDRYEELFRELAGRG